MNLPLTQAIIYTANGNKTVTVNLINSDNKRAQIKIGVNDLIETNSLPVSLLLPADGGTELTYDLESGDQIISKAETNTVTYTITENGVDVTPTTSQDNLLETLDGLFAAITGQTYSSLNSAQKNLVNEFMIFKLGGLRPNRTIKKPSKWS